MIEFQTARIVPNGPGACFSEATEQEKLIIELFFAINIIPGDTINSRLYIRREWDKKYYIYIMGRNTNFIYIYLASKCNSEEDGLEEALEFLVKNYLDMLERVKSASIIIEKINEFRSC